jgi:hypothetical protein
MAGQKIPICSRIAWRARRDCLHGGQREAGWKRRREMKEATILGLLLLLASCGWHSGQDTGLSPIESLVRQVVPPDSGGGCTPPVTGKYSATVACDLTTSWSEDSYRQWVDRRLSGPFRTRETSGGHLLMTRYVDGETRQFEIFTSPTAGTSTRVRIVLEVYAD